MLLREKFTEELTELAWEAAAEEGIDSGMPALAAEAAEKVDSLAASSRSSF